MPPHTEREKMTEAGEDAAKISEGPILGRLYTALLPGNLSKNLLPEVVHLLTPGVLPCCRRKQQTEQAARQVGS